MCLFMGKNVTPLLFIQSRRQIDFRMNHSKNKWGCYCITKITVFLVTDSLPYQTMEPNGAYRSKCQKQNRPAQPYKSCNFYHYL